MTNRTLALILGLAVALGGCAGESAVGSDALLDVDETDAGERLGALERSDDPTPSPMPVEPSPEPTPTAAPTAAPSPEPEPTAVQPQYEPMTVELGENGFQPVHLRVWAGTEVRFLNATAEPRTLTGLDDGWSSGPIAPGGVASYVTSQAGEFNFQDDTRVYYVVRVEVLQP